MFKQIVNRYAIRHLCMACIMTAWAWSNAALAQTGKPTTIPEEIRYAYLEQSIFYYVANERGEQVDGPLLRLANAVLTKAEIPWRKEAYPAPRLFNNMQNGTNNFTIRCTRRPWKHAAYSAKSLSSVQTCAFTALAISHL